MASMLAALVFIGTHIFANDEGADSKQSNATIPAKFCCNSSIFDPLAIASIRGYPEEVERILEKDPRYIGIQEETGMTPLHWAALRGNAEVVKKLLKFGANVSSVDKDNNTALHMAAFSHDLGVARVLLDAGCPVNAQNMFGYTPLHFATEQGNFGLVETLLSYGASTKVFNYKRETPLGIAVTKHDEAIVRLLRTASEHSEAHYWIEMNKNIPSDAVVGGNEPGNCHRSYIGRIMVKEHFVPAKVCPEMHHAYALLEGSEITSKEFQVLTSNHAAWRRMTDEDDIPYEAILGGTTSRGEKLYIGRSFVSFEGVLYLIPGQVRMANRRLYVTLYGEVYDKTNYEILVSY